MDATGTIRPGAAEVGIGHWFPRLPEENSNARGLISCFTSHVRSNLAEHVIRFGLAFGQRHTQHALGCRVMWGQVVFPIPEPAPARIFKDAVGRNQKRIGINQAAAAHSATVEYQHIAQ